LVKTGVASARASFESMGDAAQACCMGGITPGRGGGESV
jgi:hypothetical protein